METVRILIIEDNPVDALCLKEALEETKGANFATSHVETLTEAKQQLGSGDFHAVVLDLRLPDSLGIETFLEVKNSDPDVPIVVLSGLDDETLAIEAVRLGAQDYLLKDKWDGEVLKRSLTYAIERHQILNKLKQANESTRRALDDLHEKESRLRQVFDLAADGFWEWDIETGLVKRQASWPRILGYRLEEIEPTLGAWERLVHPDDLPLVRAEIDGCLAGNADSYENQYRMKTKSGEWKWIEDRGQIVERDENRRALRAVGALRDITSQKNAEMKSRETQRRFELALEGGDLGWWEWDVETGEAQADSRAAEFLGYSPDEIESYASWWEELVHPDDKSQVVEALNKHLCGQIALFETEYRLRTKYGDLKWVLVRGKIIARNPSGKPRRMAGTFLEITHRKLAEEALRQSEQQFRAIFEGAEDYIFLKDRNLRFIQVNPAFAKLAGVHASKIIGKRHEDVFGEEAAEFIREMEIRALAGETVEDEHSKSIRGIPMSFLATRTPLKDPSGEVVGILTVLHDITDRKRGEVSRIRTEEEYPSEAMRTTLKQAKTVAERASTVLLTGESGAGKDHLAKWIHAHSDRANGPYFAINCAAIPSELAESELFGHEKGSFTGAVARKRGMLELAEGGTLLLNEIGDLPLHLQAKLLTFLDTRKFTRVGGEKEISVNARIIAATNRNLEQSVEAGTFRKDLFYRINVLSIPVPALRERLDDIPILVREMLAKIGDDMQLHDMPVVSPAAMDALKRYHWPGNVRELRNVLERAIILSHEKEISLSVLGLPGPEECLLQSEASSFSVSFPSDKSLNEMTQELKRFLINEALQKSGGSRQGAAKLLGISRYSLKHYIKTLGYREDETAD